MERRLSRRLAVLGGLATIGAAACAAPATPTAAPARKRDEWTAILPSSDLAVGQNRFTYAVLDERNRPITDATVRLRFFELVGETAAVVSEADAPFRGQGMGDRGVYVARVELPKSGPWGVEAVVRRADGAERTLRTRFEVKEASATPAVGSSAPLTRQPLMAGATDPRAICTASPPCAFHDLTVADAIGRKLPALLLFATPAFCTSATCGPTLAALQEVEVDHRGRASFAHLEIWTDPPKLQVPHAHVAEWRLPSEPWAFVLDRDGVVRDKMEGGVSAGELREALTRVL